MIQMILNFIKELIDEILETDQIVQKKNSSVKTSRNRKFKTCKV